MTQAFNRATGWIVARPIAGWSVLLTISLIALVGYLSSDLIKTRFAAKAFDENDSRSVDGVFETPPDIEPISLTDTDAILVCQSDQFFTPDGSQAMRHVVERLEELDFVTSILWMDRVPILNIFGLNEPILPRPDATASRFAAARNQANTHPLVNGQLLSSDGRTMLLMLNFDFLQIRDDNDCTERIRQTAERAASEFPNVDIQFLVTGRVPVLLTALAAHEKNQLKYQLIGYSMILIMSLILFRGWISVLVVALAPAVGVFWTLGIIRFFDFQENPFNDVVLPILISLVGFTDGVHLLIQIRRNRAAGMSSREAAKQGIRKVGLACALTSLTTAIGFGSLVLAHHEIVQEFGMACVIGVVLTFVAVIICIPLACTSRLGRNIHVGHGSGLVDKNLSRISGIIDWVLQRTRLLTMTGILVTVSLFLIALTLEPDERRANALPTGSEAALALDQMDRAMGGLEVGEIDIAWSGNVPSDDPQVLDVIRQIDDLLAQEQLIGHPISIRNLLDALPGEGSSADRMSLLDLLPPPLKRAFYTPEYRQATISFRVQDLGIAKYGPVFLRIENGLQIIQQSHPDFTLTMSGDAVWRWQNLYQIVVDLATSLGTATVIIFIVLAIVYRSLRIGLISIVPNMFPLALAGTYLAVSGQSLELVSVCAFTVCLGIAVDDTIHFLTRYIEEKEETGDETLAIRNAFTAVGTALIMTTIVLVAGFSTVLFSDSRDHRIFASMGAITVAAALFGDLIFLPAMLKQFSPKKQIFRAKDAVENQNAS